MNMNVGSDTIDYDSHCINLPCTSPAPRLR